MIRLCAFSDEAGKSLEEQIAALQRNGISLMEIRSVDGVNVKNLTLERAREIKAALDSAGISVWSVGSPLGKTDITTEWSEIEADTRHLCELARVFGTDKIRMFSFFNAYEQSEKVYDYLSRMVAVAAAYGVSLYHENEKKIYGDTLDRVLAIMEHVKGLKFVYDPANYLQVGESAERTLAALHGKTDYFHIKDVIAATEELVPAGEGDGRIDLLVDRIKDDRVLTVEPHLAVFEGYAAIDDEQMKNKFHFTSNGEAFDAAIKAIKAVLARAGYREAKGGFVK